MPAASLDPTLAIAGRHIAENYPLAGVDWVTALASIATDTRLDFGEWAGYLSFDDTLVRTAGELGVENAVEAEVERSSAEQVPKAAAENGRYSACLW